MNNHVKGAEVFSAPVNVVEVLPVDMKEIEPYDRIAEQLTNINNINAPLYLQDFLKAKELVSKHYANALFHYGMARDHAKKMRALAKLEKAPEELKKKGIKQTDGNAESYAEMEPEYLAAKEREYYWEALKTLLFTKLMKFQAAHEDAQLIFKQTKIPLGSISSMGDHQLKEEGN
jgi:hypothetical protein